jgi:hypothetical protein
VEARLSLRITDLAILRAYLTAYATDPAGSARLPIGIHVAGTDDDRTGDDEVRCVG